MMIFIVVRIILEMVFEIVGVAIKDLVVMALSYDDEVIEIRSTSKSSDILQRLGKASVTGMPKGDPVIVKDPSPDSLHIATHAFLGPAFRGGLKTSDDDCLLRGRLTLNNSARWAYATVIIGLVLAVIATLISSMGLTSICVSTSAAFLLAMIAGLRISAHKRNLVPTLRDELREALLPPVK